MTAGHDKPRGSVYIDPDVDRLTLTAIMTGWIADAWGIDKTLLAESMKLAGVAGPRLTEAERLALTQTALPSPKKVSGRG